MITVMLDGLGIVIHDVQMWPFVWLLGGVAGWFARGIEISDLTFRNETLRHQLEDAAKHIKESVNVDHHTQSWGGSENRRRDRAYREDHTNTRHDGH